MDFSPLVLLAETTQPNSLIYSFQQTGIAGRIIVAILLILNLFSFTVLFSKIWTLAEARRRNEEFLRNYRQGESPLDVFLREERFIGSPIWSLYRSACFELNQILRLTPENQIKPHARLMPTQMESVRAAIERSFGERVLQLESRMSILASAVSGAPFLGLLGTVWGVMNTFSAVAASQGNPNLSEMSPGISAALLTTVFALLVAIPAMFGYNFLVNQIRATIASLENFRAEFLATAERLYVQHHAAPQPAQTQLAEQTQEKQPKPTSLVNSSTQPKQAIEQNPKPQQSKQSSSFGLTSNASSSVNSASDKLPEHSLESARTQAPAQARPSSSEEKALDKQHPSSRHSPLREQGDVLDDIQQLLAAERARQANSDSPQGTKPNDPPIKLPNPGV